MVHQLWAQAFCAALLSDVQEFDCGSEPWQLEVAQWIKGNSDDNALMRMAEGTEVWLYRDSNHQVVGYGSLGKSEWSWPPPRGPKEVVSIVPFFGVQARFHGEPKDVPHETRFAQQIVRDLIAKAVSHGTRVLGLFVDEENKRAIKFYEQAGFLSLSAAGKKYRRMYLYLRNPPMQRSSDPTTSETTDG